MSNASSKCLLKGISKGQGITISAISACGSTGTIVLKDDNKTYATLQKTSLNHLYQYLGNAHCKYEGGNNLRIEVDLNHISYAISLKQIVTKTDIVDSKGNVVGASYVIAIEDYDDYDYNDIVISILVTNKM